MFRCLFCCLLEWFEVDIYKEGFHINVCIENIDAVLLKVEYLSMYLVPKTFYQLKVTTLSCFMQPFILRKQSATVFGNELEVKFYRFSTNIRGIFVWANHDTIQWRTSTLVVRLRPMSRLKKMMMTSRKIEDIFRKGRPSVQIVALSQIGF